MDNAKPIAVIDYGLGNVRSIVNMFKKVGVAALSTRNPDLLREASKLVPPGVGSFDAGMRNLEKLGLRRLLDELVLEAGVPILGICLGMQLLAESSEEGQSPGLGWIAGRAVRFCFEGGEKTLRIPHMGWNLLEPRLPSPLLPDPEQENWFYFAHSYHVQCRVAEHCLAQTTYGLPFTAMVGRENIAGVQFHPEKSHRFGMELFRQFAASDGGRLARAA